MIEHYTLETDILKLAFALSEERFDLCAAVYYPRDITFLDRPSEVIGDHLIHRVHVLLEKGAATKI